MSDLRDALEIMGEFRSGIHPLEIDHGLRLGDPYVAFRRRGCAATWSRFRALRPVPILPLTLANMQLAQQGNHLMVDVLRAVIGIKAMNGEGEIGDERFEDRKHVVLGDSAYGAHGRELGDLVDQVDVVEPLHAIEVALMQGIDAAGGIGWGLRLSPMGDAHQVCLIPPVRGNTTYPSNSYAIGKGCS